MESQVVILFADFETTGLLDKRPDFMVQPGIVQIGAIRCEWNRNHDPHLLMETDSFYTLVNPERAQWQDDAIRTHGITPDAVKDAPTFFEIGPAFAEFTRGAEYWIGFNNKFDRDVLWYQLVRYGLERNYPWPTKEIDVMKRASKLMEVQGKKGVKNPKLTDAYEHFFGKAYMGAHDALSDIRATADVFRRVMQGEANEDQNIGLGDGVQHPEG